MLSDFFRINMPYGIAKNENDEWMAFNREYMPIGFNSVKEKGSPGHSYLDLPVYTKYLNLTDKLLLELADDESSVQHDETGRISRIFLYSDETNPLERLANKKRFSMKKDLWKRYIEKLEKLAGLERG